jgi:hypothetical protein
MLIFAVFISMKSLRKLIRKCLSESAERTMPFQDTVLHYQEIGSIEGIKVPALEGNSQWLFNQLLLICDELRENKIDTGEVLNYDNWGMKDGNLALFDIGFGNYFESFHEEPEEMELNETDLLSKVKGKMGIGHSEYLGGGQFGFAHDIGDGKVLKITKDKSEAVNSQKLKGRELTHLANIYDVRAFRTDDTQYYTIILEKLEVQTWFDEEFEALKEAFDAVRNMHLEQSVIEDIGEKNPEVGEFLADMIHMGYEETWQKWGDKLRESGLSKHIDFNDVSEIASWIKGSTTNDHEIDEQPPSYITDIVNSLK